MYIRKPLVNPVFICTLVFQVTTIDNLDLYGIDLTEFASAVQKGVACSATIEKINKDDKRVTVQGNQIKFIGQLLKGKLTCCLAVFTN